MPLVTSSPCHSGAFSNVLRKDDMGNVPPLEMVSSSCFDVLKSCDANDYSCVMDHVSHTSPIVPIHSWASKKQERTLESSPRYESKIDTLLPGHPLVVTTAPHIGRGSINDIKVTEWDMYNDGRLIVHGAEDFFDPAFQTLLYPRYDSNNRSNKNGINESGVDEAVLSSLGSTASSWEKDMTVDNLFVMLAVVSLAGSALSLECLYRANRRYSGYRLLGIVCEIFGILFSNSDGNLNALQYCFSKFIQCFCEVTFGGCS
ncbi:hypothetical protein RHMOL_Rhmol01G0017100 [Rhododendron molle]|uniref:Uncharacterized protein n=1 Tax=Rhododendron molle TaxID=49168 RepID=A0ACC0PXL7_RHOML|nr:hypothetical protein RHMOL_Rhmol01G0017100 [Rhododendron molle]